MRNLLNRSKTVRELGSFYLRHPRRHAEVWRALAARSAKTINRREPWWPFVAIDAVAERLTPNAQVFEYGGGGSSLWLVDRGASITIAEHDPEWADQLRTSLPEQVEIMSAPPEATGSITSDTETGFFDAYVATIDALNAESLDLVIVDGRARVACGERASTKIKPGGHLLLDDSERPRYSQLYKTLSDWHRIDYRGAKAGGQLATTSVWTKPLEP